MSVNSFQAAWLGQLHTKSQVEIPECWEANRITPGLGVIKVSERSAVKERSHLLITQTILVNQTTP